MGVEMASTEPASTLNTHGDGYSRLPLLAEPEGEQVHLTWQGDNQSFTTEELGENEDHSKHHWLMQSYVGGMPSGPSRAMRHVPESLWDTTDVNFVDQVMCHAFLKVWKIDPKIGRFTCRMKCHWKFRLLKYDLRTEPRVRIPGIRMPALSCSVDESRVWRDLSKDTRSTMYFSGSSVFSFEGFQVLEIQDFPFDRQLLDLGLLEFVWRREKDTDTYEESMRIVQFSIETQSLLPQWRPSTACLKSLNELPFTGDKPIHATRFRVKLRLTRRVRYYLIQVFLLTFLILVATLLPLGLKAWDVGNRLGLLAGGLLTLTAFKFSIAEQLPSVPYSTFLDNYLLMQVVTICVVMSFVVIDYKFNTNEQEDRWRYLSDALLLLIVLAWTGAFSWFALCNTRRTWQAILNADRQSAEDRTDVQHADHPEYA